MTWSMLDIIFLATLVILALVPKKKPWLVLFATILLLNLGIRVHYINKSHRLQKDLDDTRKLAQPPTLTLHQHKTHTVGNTHTFTFQFLPSKNEQLGMISFVATIEQDGDAKIVDFWPSTNSPAFSHGPQSKQITPDGRQARLTYSLLSAGPPVIDVTVEGRAPIRLEGNYMTNALVLKPGKEAAEQPPERDK